MFKKFYILFFSLFVSFCALAADLPNGIYRIANAYNKAYGWDANGLSWRMYIYPWHHDNDFGFKINNNTQAFRLEKQPNSSYTITALHSKSSYENTGLPDRENDYEQMGVAIFNNGDAEYTYVVSHGRNTEFGAEWVFEEITTGQYKGAYRIRINSNDSRIGEFRYVSSNFSAGYVPVLNGSPMWLNKQLDTPSQYWYILPVVEGPYRIEWAYDIDYGLSVEKGIAEGHANICSQKYVSKAQNQWWVKQLDIDKYAIYTKLDSRGAEQRTHFYLNLHEGKAGENVQLWESDAFTDNAAQWQIKKAKDPATNSDLEGVFSIIPVSQTTQALDLDLGNKDGGNIHVWNYNAQEKNQHWRFVPIGVSGLGGKDSQGFDKRYTILFNRNKQKGFNVEGNSTESDKKVSLWDECGSEAQTFQLYENRDGMYSIKYVKANKFMKENDGDNITQIDTTVSQLDMDKSATQWIITKNFYDENSYNILNHRLLKNADLDAGNENNGTKIHLWSVALLDVHKEWPNQVWHLEPCVPVPIKAIKNGSSPI